MTDRPKALVTAPFRGDGLETLRELCSDVVLDPWIDHRPLRLYRAEQLAERIEAEGANLLVVESDSVKGPVLDLPLVAIGSCRGDPTNVDIPGATERGIPVLRAPGRNADAVAELTVGLLLAVNRGIVRADRDVREGQVWRDGTIPYQRFRAWQIAGRTAGIIGLGAVGRATEVAARGARHAGHRLRPVLAGLRPTRSTTSSPRRTSCRCTRPSPRRPRGSSAASEFARMKDDAIFINSARAQLHDTDALVAALQGRRDRGRRPRPLRRREPPARPSAVLDGQRRAHARTSAARPGTPR